MQIPNQKKPNTPNKTITEIQKATKKTPAKKKKTHTLKRNKQTKPTTKPIQSKQTNKKSWEKKSKPA